MKFVVQEIDLLTQ